MRAKGSLDKSALGPARSTTAELNLCRDTSTIFQIDAPFSALVTSLPGLRWLGSYGEASMMISAMHWAA